MKRKFEEVVVEETVVEETAAPSAAEQFVSLLVNMGLSAEQAEAVHQMAMDLIEAGGQEEATEVVETVEVAASKQKRMKKSNLSAEQKLDMLERRVRRLSRKMRETEGGQPAARKFNTRPEGRSKEVKHAIPAAPAEGTQGRAFEMMNQILNQ